MNTKKVLFAILLIALAGVIIWKYAAPKQLVAPVDIVTDTSPEASSIAGAVKNSAGDFEYKKENDYVIITATFPAKVAVSDMAETKIRASVEQMIDETVERFERNINEMLSPDEQARLKEDGRKYAMGIDYKMYTSPGYVSYSFLIYEDTGGAHPNSYNKTLVFDLNGNIVLLADLFKDGSRYLDRLSAASYKIVLAELEKRMGVKIDDTQIDTVRMGTAPTPENLQFFYLDNGNIVLMFPPYQVAAYAAGAFEARIPLSSLSDIFKK